MMNLILFEGSPGARGKGICGIPTVDIRPGARGKGICGIARLYLCQLLIKILPGKGLISFVHCGQNGKRANGWAAKKIVVHNGQRF